MSTPLVDHRVFRRSPGIDLRAVDCTFDLSAGVAEEIGSDPG